MMLLVNFQKIFCVLNRFFFTIFSGKVAIFVLVFLQNAVAERSIVGAIECTKVISHQLCHLEIWCDSIFFIAILMNFLICMQTSQHGYKFFFRIQGLDLREHVWDFFLVLFPQKKRRRNVQFEYKTIGRFRWLHGYSSQDIEEILDQAMEFGWGLTHFWPSYW